MSGQIINPFSSDFKTPGSAYSGENIPVAAYALIGITSLTLAYVTLIESTQGDMTGPKSPSATSMLPSISSPFSSFSKPASPSMQVSPLSPSPVPASAEAVRSSPPMAEAVPISQGKPSTGGKTKRKKHKKHKNKSANKK